MRVQKKYSAWAFVVLLAAVVWINRSPVAAQSSARITGTFSNLRYNKEAGDLLGYELKIVPAAGGRFQGALQIAEGAPSELMVVDIQAKGPDISFSIPDKYESYAGQFSGTVAAAGLKGEFKFKGGGGEKVELKRGKGYWD
jgi:hypothetical protein